jgi:hypothetical protein
MTLWGESHAYRGEPSLTAVGGGFSLSVVFGRGNLVICSKQNRDFLRHLRMDKDLHKRKVEALAVLSLSTVILIVFFSMGVVLLSLQALEARLEMGAGQPVHGSVPWKRMASNAGG